MKRYVAISEVFKVKQAIGLKMGAECYESGREFQEGMGQAIAMDLLASSWRGLHTVLLYSENDQRKEHAASQL